MNIDPLTIPCPFCEEIIIERSDEDSVTCEVCDIHIPVHEWIEGGINALVGKLARSGVEVWKSEDGWTWDGDGVAGKAWQTFEYCVLDAWEKMGEEEPPTAPRGVSESARIGGTE